MSTPTLPEVAAPEPLVVTEELRTGLPTPRGVLWAVDGVSLTIADGTTMGLAGESGSGKTMLVRSLMGLVPPGAVREGSIRFDGHDMSRLSATEQSQLWGKEIAMVFQDPMTSLNPVLRIGRQITESLRYHTEISRGDARQVALELLRQMGIPEPARRLSAYPHQLSGGMRQRVAIAIALALGPKLLLADEPTTALDVTVQAQILDLLSSLQAERGMAMVLVTHDLGVLANHTSEIAIMYAGRIVEKGPTNMVLTRMKMPYTQALIAASPTLADATHTRLTTIPGRPPDLVAPPTGCRFAPRCPYAQERCWQESPPLRPTPGDPGHLYACWYPVPDPPAQGQAAAAPATSRADLGGPMKRQRPPQGDGSAAPTPHLRPGALLSVEHLSVEFSVAGQRVHAVSDVSFDVKAGETLGIVGESGCGKSTTARAIVGLPRPKTGRVVFDGEDISARSDTEFRRLRPRLQMIFQDPISSLNPGRRVADILGEPLAVWGRTLGIDPASRGDRIVNMMEAVGLDYHLHADRRPYQLSGGQCQRVSIGRALMLEPELLVCDEPVSSLDVSVQAQILNLLEDMKARQHLTMIFIAHNMAVVKNVSDRVAVMYLGKLCELADPTTLQEAPAHPYTAALLASVPDPAPDRSGRQAKPTVVGEPASPISPPSGCRFRTRCPQARDRCAAEEPLLAAVGEGHYVACHFPLTAGGAATPVAVTSPR